MESRQKTEISKYSEITVFHCADCVDVEDRLTYTSKQEEDSLNNIIFK